MQSADLCLVILVMSIAVTSVVDVSDLTHRRQMLV